jgi:putative tryptophan/tyrosine transport system substrate-binding protein
MRRRDFVALLGGVAIWPLSARAQQPRMPVIGYLGAESPDRFTSRLRAFREGLATAGFTEGRNVAIEYRWAEGNNEQLPALAAELVRHPVNVLVAPGSVASALAAKAATQTIPIVFESGADPVATGLVASMNRPGGNITGITSLNSQVAPKRLELLHEIAPGATVFALLVNPTNPTTAETSTKDLTEAARALGLQLHVLNASTENDFDPVFTKLAQLHAAGLVIANDAFFNARSKQLAELALRHLVAAAHQSRDFAEAGGLLSYGGSFRQTHSQAGAYVGRILKGEKPGELPVVQVTTVELTVNLKTAKALGVNVPLSLLGRADEVIE